jgi:menaquinone-9 beta-reductase
MGEERFDVLVVGAGPGGSVASLVLARGGARVALVDKATFPRDKACGDLIGPRGLRVLDELGVDLTPTADGSVTVGDMLVVGPTGRRVVLPSAPGMTYPGDAVSVPRLRLDALLRDLAAKAGAELVTARAGNPIWDPDGERLGGFELEGGRRLVADLVVGADGATSRVAESAGLVDPARVMWGFAVRAYLRHHVDVPTIVMWEPTPRRALCGYGWLFPGPGGLANVGVGAGTLADRRNGAEAVRLLPAFVEHLRRLGLLADDAEAPDKRLGGWLKIGMVGTTPTRAGVMLVGDAAGLVNPLQGEGIAHAMTSARAASEAYLGGPSDAVATYRRSLAANHLPYHRVTAAAHRGLMRRPAVISALGRAATLPGLSTRVAEGWALFWNELLDGAPPGKARSWAAAATTVGRIATSRTVTARWFDRTLRPSDRSST